MKRVKISEVCIISNGYAFKSSKYVNDEGARIIRITNVQKGKIEDNDPKLYPFEELEKLDSYKIFEGDILMSLTGNVGRVGKFPKKLLPAYINQRVCRVMPKNDSLDVNYLFHYLNSSIFENEAINNSAGAAQLNLSSKWLANHEIPLPPLAEQQVIAEKLDQAQKIIDLNEAEVARYDKLAQALFIDMFGDPVQNPKGWEMKKLGEITNKIGSGATPRGGKESYKEEGIALIRSMNVYDNRFFYKDLAFIDSAQADKLKNVCVEENDILFNITGASICRSTIVPKDVLPARVNQHVSIIRMKKSVATPLFVNHLLISASVKRSLLNIGSGGGAIMQAITKQGLEDFEIILPPITLQNEFAKRIEQIELLKNQAQQELEQSKNLFQSLLQESFKG
ncbi:restriction endonuclease subunit S [Riemerella anatipestifer]|uniref:restriction endonuclease subunit S n=1 Tax=Riemerella anatipestifer TaxID=34085 RepID=UPI0030C2D665